MKRSLLFVSILALLVFFSNLGEPSVFILDEARNASCAMEMQQRKDWVVPTFNAELRSDKPPLHYYFMRIAYSIWGYTPFAARFFQAFMGVLLLLGVYRFAKKFGNERMALYACVILTSSLQCAFQFRLAVPDPFLISFLTLSILFFYEGFVSGKTLPLMLSYTCLAMATLAKGPLAPVFFSLIAGIFLLATRSFSLRQLLRLKVPAGILLFLALVLPWYVAVGLRTEGQWLNQFFLKHNLGRFTSTMEGHGAFPLASFVILLIALMPFSFFAPQMLKRVWHKRKEDPFLLICLISVAVVTLFFTFSKTLLPGYLGPALPFFAILLGYYWQSLMDEKMGKNSFVSAYLLLAAGLAIPVAVWIAAQKDSVLKSIPFVWAYTLPVLAGALTALVFLYRNQVRTAFYAYAASFLVLILLFFCALYPRFDALNPVSNSLQLVRESSGLAYYKRLNSAYVFALQKPIEKLDNAADLNHFLSRPGNRVISYERILQDIDSTTYTVVFRQQDLFERGVTLIIEKRN